MGVEILDIEHTRVKFKINIIIKIKFLNREQRFRYCRNMKNIR
jgi:hypothetical protein